MKSEMKRLGKCPDVKKTHFSNTILLMVGGGGEGAVAPKCVLHKIVYCHLIWVIICVCTQ